MRLHDHSADHLFDRHADLVVYIAPLTPLTIPVGQREQSVDYLDRVPNLDLSAKPVLDPASPEVNERATVCVATMRASNTLRPPLVT